MKKMLYICNRVFWPPMGGHEVKMFHYSRGLHDKFDFEIDVYVFDDAEKIDLKKKPLFINDVYIAHPINKKTIVKNIVGKTLFGKNAWPIQCSLYFSKENFIEISNIISNGEYNAVFVDMIRLAPYFEAFKNTSIKKILDIEDMLSKRYRRQLNLLDNKTVIAGQYNYRLPRWIKTIISFNYFKRKVLSFEIPRMENAEKRYGEMYDKVVFVSAIETEELNSKYQGEKVVTVAMGVDYTFFSEDIKVDKEHGTASFVGNMKTAANIDSVRMIINQVLSNSEKLKRIDFIGGCSEELIIEFKDNPKVRFVGRVEDFRPYVRSTELFLSPLAYGTGIKTKILEAMAMGMPVVTNSVGAEGIPAENNFHWLNTNDFQKMGEYIDHIIENQDEGLRIGKNAQKFVKEGFQWDYIFDQFSRLGL